MATVRADVGTPTAELLDSMGFVEFLLQVAGDIGTTPQELEARFGGASIPSGSWHWH
jgi:hypothetical protein